MTTQSVFLVVAGALFSAAWFVFFDGMIIARSTAQPYQFLMWLPCILSLLGTIMMCLSDPKHILVDESDLMAFDDSREEQRSKVFFFIGSLLLLGSLSLALWRMMEPYSQSSNPWPGIAILLQNTLLAAFSAVFYLARGRQEGDFAF